MINSTRLRAFAALTLVLALVATIALAPGGGDALAGAKVTICHNDGKTEITVSENAITGHFESQAQYEASGPGNPLGPHGDYKGPCVAAPVVTPTEIPPTPTPTPSPTPTPTPEPVSTMPVFD